MEDVLHPVLRAALEGNLRLLKEMAPVTGKRDFWNCALLRAAMAGRLDVCRYLVEDIRVNVNWVSNKNETALYYSVTFGTAATTRYLLDRGADPTAFGRKGSVLHGAAKNGKHETVELLLSRGVDVDLFDPVRGTPLHVATKKGEASTMKILLEHHSDPNKVYGLHSNPLSMAIQKESLECVRLLIKAGADVNFIDYIGVTLVMVTAYNGLPDIMKCLLDAGANPNTPDAFGRTAIEIAALHGRRDIVQMLFPLASPISTLPDWSIDGIISHVKYYGLNPRDKHPLELEEKIAKLKLDATEAFKRKEYPKAVELYNCASRCASY